MKRFLDFFSRKKPDLTSAQNALVRQLNQEFAEPMAGLTPSKLKMILQSAEQGYLQHQADLFTAMEAKDAQILTEISKRKRVLQGLQWTVVPPQNATPEQKAIAKNIIEFILEINDLPALIFNCADAIGKGFSMVQIADADGNTGWEFVDNTWIIKNTTFVHQRNFGSPMANRNKITLRNYVSDEGEELLPFGWIQHFMQAMSGYVGSSGLYKTLAIPYLLKNEGISSLISFLKIYGIPLRQGRYPRTATDDEKSSLLNALLLMGQNTAGIIPEGMRIELLEAADGKSEVFQDLINYCDMAISKAILGGTLTSQSDGKTSTYALGSVHENSAWAISVADARALSATFTKYLVYPLAYLNIPNMSDKLLNGFRFEFITDREDELSSFAPALNQFADGISKLCALGYPISQNYIEQKTGITLPTDKDILLKSPSASSLEEKAAESFKIRMQDNEVTDKETLADIYQMLDPHWETFIQKIKVILEESDDLKDFEGKLIEAFGEIPENEIMQVFMQAYRTAYLKGMSDVLEGN